MMASRRRLSGERGLVGCDVATPAPTSLNTGRGKGDVGAKVLPSSSAFGDDVARSSTVSFSGGRGGPWRNGVEG